jgi:hypothetical protein
VSDRLPGTGEHQVDAGRRQVPDGYESGPEAPIRAAARALARVAGARAVVLVEGISDQVAVETVATCLGRDLTREGVVVVPMGGAHAIRQILATDALRVTSRPDGGDTGPGRRPPRLTALCDRREAAIFDRALAGVEHLGLYVCVEDLEDELIRGAGVPTVEALFEAHGDLSSLRTLQSQPAWRGRPPEAQIHRFLSAGARRKIRYARLLAEAAPPGPVTALLAAVAAGVTDE